MSKVLRKKTKTAKKVAHLQAVARPGSIAEAWELYQRLCFPRLADDSRRYFPPRTAWHAYRHWGASELARRGCSTFEIQNWLGDKSADVACGYVAMVRGETTALRTISLLSENLAGKKKFPEPEIDARTQELNSTSGGDKSIGPSTCSTDTRFFYKEKEPK